MFDLAFDFAEALVELLRVLFVAAQDFQLALIPLALRQYFRPDVVRQPNDYQQQPDDIDHQNLQLLLMPVDRNPPLLGSFPVFHSSCLAQANY